MYMDIEKLFSLVCNNKIKEVKEYYQSGGKANRRFSRFGKEHSLIMGAIRNSHCGDYTEMIEVLRDNGETVLEHEREEYNKYKAEIGK